MKIIKVNEDVCVLCHLCEIACIVEHSESKDILKVFKREKPRPIARCAVEEDKPLSFSLMCRHCDDAPCVKACSNGSMHRDERGYVVVDEETCIGCWMCIMVCPYGVIRRDERRQKWNLSTKCNMCPDRDIPACVEVCPNEALVLGDVVECT
ncbi:MAG: 4Fe-4S dicluster domain-containing protein [Desulfurellaceae bacterium]|nr:4Fe-4S dicluster domain-containing protein [Desulfurellaceae bacterium]